MEVKPIFVNDCTSRLIKETLTKKDSCLSANGRPLKRLQLSINSAQVLKIRHLTDSRTLLPTAKCLFGQCQLLLA